MNTIAHICPPWTSFDNQVNAFTTLRQGGYSQYPYDSFNLADHVGDAIDSVNKNRNFLLKAAKLPQYPLFLTQTHSTTVIQLPYANSTAMADAVYTNKSRQVCVVMTADCLPILLTNQQGNEVAAIHAGWRGLCNGIIERTVNCFKSEGQHILAWLGPAIGPNCFQVGEEVLDAFIQQDRKAEVAFKVDANCVGKYFANLYQLATLRLNNLGITKVSGGEHCTYTEQEKFFSYRRHKQTGRMASLIWFDDK